MNKGIDIINGVNFFLGLLQLVVLPCGGHKTSPCTLL